MKKNKNVLFLGLVSFFTDLSTKMVYPIIPLYLMTVFGVTPTVIGLIEGIVDSMASLLKVVSGFLSDRIKWKKWLACSGYATGLVYKLLLFFAGSWGGILFAKIVDRFGKGIRTTPRDMLLAESGGKQKLGRAFGLQKMFDKAGSALGILIVYVLLLSGLNDYRMIFLFSAIPAVFGLCMFFFIKEPQEIKSKAKKPKIAFFDGLKQMDGRLKLYLLVVLLFNLGSSSTVFILLRAQNVGFADTNVMLLFFIFTISASLLAYPVGRLSDRIGRKALLVAAYFIFAVVYFSLALAPNAAILVVAFIMLGAYTAILSVAERAFVAELAPPNLLGTLLGLKSTIVGLVILPANLIAGVLWDTIGAWAPFALSAGLAMISAVMLLIFLKPSNHESPHTP